MMIVGLMSSITKLGSCWMWMSRMKIYGQSGGKSIVWVFLSLCICVLSINHGMMIKKYFKNLRRFSQLVMLVENW